MSGPAGVPAARALKKLPDMFDTKVYINVVYTCMCVYILMCMYIYIYIYI